MRNAIAKGLVWSLFFLAGAVLLTWPLAQHLGTHIPGAGGDGLIFLWDMWWVKHALLTSHVNPFNCPFLFAPQGVDLTFHTLWLLPAIISMPMQGIFGLVLSFNVLYLLGFVLTGLGMVLFFRQIRIGFPDNLIGAIVFTYSPYVIIRSLGHFNLTSTWPIPWTVLFFWRLRRFHRPRDAVTFGILWACSLLTDLHYAYFLGLMIGLVLIYDIFVFLRHKNNITVIRLKKISLLGLLATFSFLLLAWPEIISIIHLFLRHNDFRAVINTQIDFSLDLVALIIPNTIQSIWGNFLIPLRDGFGINGIEQSGYLGLVAIVLVIIGLWLYRKHKQTSPFLRWVMLGMCFAVLSLGPFLKLAGNATFKIASFSFSVSMPFRVVRLLPLVQSFRTPNRLQVMTCFCLAIAVAYSFKALRVYLNWDLPVHRQWKSKAFLLTIIISSLIVLDVFPVPYPLLDARIPPVYSQIQRLPTVHTVLDIPLGWRSGDFELGDMQPQDQYYQTSHEKMMIGGYISRVAIEQMYYYSNRPGIPITMAPWETKLYQDPANACPAFRQTLITVNVDGLIVHKNQLSAHALQQLQDYIASCDFKATIEDSQNSFYPL